MLSLQLGILPSATCRQSSQHCEELLSPLRLPPAALDIWLQQLEQLSGPWKLGAELEDNPNLQDPVVGRRGARLGI